MRAEIQGTGSNTPVLAVVMKAVHADNVKISVALARSLLSRTATAA
jgi:hypothetical protein